MEELFKFLAVSQLAENRGADRTRARNIGLIAGVMPGWMGLMMGLVVANREEQAAATGVVSAPASTAASKASATS